MPRFLTFPHKKTLTPLVKALTKYMLKDIDFFLLLVANNSLTQHYYELCLNLRAALYQELCEDGDLSDLSVRMYNITIYRFYKTLGKKLL
jgi:hypothetical protein